MAGKETNGFDVSEADLYKNASYIITPCGAPEDKIEILANLARKIGLAQLKLPLPKNTTE